MAIQLNREGIALSAEERNKRNQNWAIIEENINTAATDYNDALDYVAEQAYSQVLDASKLDWQEPVATFSELATTYPNATEGYTSQTLSDGWVYRFNGSEWNKIQQMDASPVTALDTRLTAQLAETELQAQKSKQSYKSMYRTLGIPNKDDIFIYRENAERLATFIHHNDDKYQEWRITKEDYAFDAAFAEHASGDPYLSDLVYNTRLYKSKDVQDTSADITKVGTPIVTGANTYLETSGNYFEYTFFGSSIRLSYLAAANAGIAKITIDGRADLVNQLQLTNGEALLDQYGAATTVSTWLAIGLANKYHTIRLQVTGNKNATSSGIRLYLDYLRFEHPVFENGDKTLAGLTTQRVNLPSGVNFFRGGRSAIELAISNTLNGNTMWSGSVHRNARPLLPAVFYLDGQVLNFDVGQWFYGKELIMYQEIILTNNGVDIARLYLTHSYTKDGLTVSWDLEWLVNLFVNNSYTGMFGTEADRIKFGGDDTTIPMIGDNLEKGSYYTDHGFGWSTTDNFMAIIELLNYEADTLLYEFYDKGMFVWDRSTDAKMYAPKFKGEITAGTKWRSIFKVGLKHQSKADLLLK